MTEHRLVANNIHRDGRSGTYWTCTCGEWHPNSAKNPPPWGGGRAPADVVMRYIKSEHAKHSAMGNKP